VPHFWEFVKHYIASPLEHANGEITTEDIYRNLVAEQMYLFVVRRPLICAAATCEIVQYPRKKAIRVVTLGGENFGEWGAVLNDVLLAWAERIKADGIEAYVRAGLVTKLEQLGYKQIYVGMWNGQATRKSDGTD